MMILIYFRHQACAVRSCTSRSPSNASGDLMPARVRIMLRQEEHMAVLIKKIELWRSEVPNQAGTLANILGPLATSGADLRVVMGYR